MQIISDFDTLQLLLPLSLRLVIIWLCYNYHFSSAVLTMLKSNVSLAKREECDHLPVFCMKLGAPWPKLL